MFLGKTDNRVKPSPVDGGSNPFSTSSNSGRNAGNNRRPAAPATVGGGKPTQKISKSVKAVKNFFKHPVNERNMAVMRDMRHTTAEIWITFIVTLLVGCFFAGGGLYLVWLGSKNNVVDFVVVGGLGTLIGMCLAGVGMFLFCKPLCLAHQKRREERSQEKEQAMVQAEYVSKAKAKLLTMQIADTLTNRRPSHVELYGHEDDGSLSRAGKPGGSRQLSASSSATVYDLPPPVALPNRSKEGDGLDSQKTPVILTRETSADDRLAIANAAERKDLVRRALLRAQEQNENSSKAEIDDSIHNRDAVSDVENVQLPLEPDVTVSESNHQLIDDLSVSDGQQEVALSSDDRIEHPEPNHIDNDEERPTVPKIINTSGISGSTSVTVEVDQEEEEYSAVDRRRSILSAANERQKSASPETNLDDDDDTIEVVPH